MLKTCRSLQSLLEAPLKVCRVSGAVCRCAVRNSRVLFHGLPGEQVLPAGRVIPRVLDDPHMVNPLHAARPLRNQQHQGAQEERTRRCHVRLSAGRKDKPPPPPPLPPGVLQLRSAYETATQTEERNGLLSLRTPTDRPPPGSDARSGHGSQRRRIYIHIQR